VSNTLQEADVAFDPRASSSSDLGRLARAFVDTGQEQIGGEMPGRPGARQHDELATLLALQIDLTGEPFAAPKIRDTDGLSEHLPDICDAIHSRLSSRQLEATYQRCLAIELESAGVRVASEVSVALTY
jgi:hypothetical protein